MPVHWGPLSAWTVGAVSIALLALVEYLRRYFVSKEQHVNEAAKLARETDHLAREIAKRLEYVERTVEAKMVTQSDFKQSRERFGERMGVVEQGVTEAKGDAKYARDTSVKASSDVEYLTKRMEEMIAGALRELKTQVQILGEQRRSQ